MSTALSLILLLLSQAPANALLPPKLKILTECQSQAGVPLVFNSDNYIFQWDNQAERVAHSIKVVKDRCAEIRKKFPGEGIRIVGLKGDKVKLVHNVKSKKAKQEEINKYMGDLRKDMEKFGGKEMKACVDQMKKWEKDLPVLADALIEEANSICEDQKD